jgi:hypothetical protein
MHNEYGEELVNGCMVIALVMVAWGLLRAMGVPI